METKFCDLPDNDYDNCKEITLQIAKIVNSMIDKKINPSIILNALFLNVNSIMAYVLTEEQIKERIPKLIEDCIKNSLILKRSMNIN
jgi:hypothetical protein